MKLRAVTDFLSHQPANNLGPDNQGYQQTGQYRGYRTESHVLIGVKADPVGENLSQMP
jgi:hypothetical protein